MSGSGRRRVVITGAGVVSSLGATPEELYENLAAGRCGVRRMSEWKETSRSAGGSGGPEGECGEDDSPDFPPLHGTGGTVFGAGGTGRGGGCGAFRGVPGGRGVRMRHRIHNGRIRSIAETFRLLLSGRGEEIPATQFFKCVSHTAAFNAANLLRVCGVVESPSAACASGLQAVGLARDLIAGGVQKAVICGGRRSSRRR